MVIPYRLCCFAGQPRGRAGDGLGRSGHRADEGGLKGKPVDGQHHGINQVGCRKWNESHFYGGAHLRTTASSKRKEARRLAASDWLTSYRQATRAIRSPPRSFVAKSAHCPVRRLILKLPMWRSTRFGFLTTYSTPTTRPPGIQSSQMSSALRRVTVRIVSKSIRAFFGLRQL